MSEQSLNLYASYAFTDAFWSESEESRKTIRKQIVDTCTKLGDTTHLYKVFPARCDTDFLVWTAWQMTNPNLPSKIFPEYSESIENFRKWVHPVQTLWGLTRVSSYSRGKSEQDMDPFEGERASYLVIYPFSKSKEWYLMSMDARQGQMNEHIKIGKQYFDIKQLLIYSFGLQDQEFVVSYEMEDLGRFSELVNALRSTEGRRHTSLDTPLITAFYTKPENF